METRLFDPEDPPEWLDPEWWRGSPNCDHLAHPADVHRARIIRAARYAHQYAMAWGAKEIVDIGAGDGSLLLTLGPLTAFRDYTTMGYEIIDDSVRVAREKGIDVWKANVTHEAAHRVDTPFTRHVCKATRGRRLIVCTEMLEHIEDPHLFVQWLSQRCAGIVASSPHGETAERHETNHAWAWDRAGYRALFENNGFVIEEHTDAEWSQVLVASTRWTW